MVNVAGVAGLHKQAQGYSNLAEAALELDVSEADRGLVHEYLAIYLAGVGRWRENETYSLSTAAIAETIGNRRLWQEAISCLALTTMWRGEIERSAELRRQVFEAAARDEDRQIQVWGLCEQAEMALLHGDSDAAARLLTQAGEIAGDLGLTEQIWLNGLLAETRRRLGDMAGARTAVDAAQAAISAAPPSAFYLTAPIAGMIAVNMALWREAPDNAALKKRAKKSIDLIARYARSFPVARPRKFLWQGIYNWAEGDEEKAAIAWQKGMASARELQMPYEEGLLLLSVGRSYRCRIERTAAVCDSGT